MMKIPLFLAFALANSIALNFTQVSKAAPAPSTVGECTNTYISTLGTRLIDALTGEPIPDSGISVHLNNGIMLIASTKIPAAEASLPGDQVQVCLESVPENCRTGDNRGKMYKVINYRTRQEFTLSNSVYSCKE